MKAIRNLFLFIGIGLVVLVFIAWYSGFFLNVELKVQDIGPIYAVFEDHIGEYNQTDEIKEKLFGMLWDDGIDNYKDFGIYYDDPGNTEVSQLKCKIGRVIEKNQVAELGLLENKYQLFTFSRQKAAIIEMPYVNSFSLYAGIYKAYPRLKAFAAQNNYAEEPVIEILDDSKGIQFILPIVESEKE
ncbi:MAG: GyrI-like domain-containing protein [Bacteroidales bacterium]|nr:GyrI-like domain-containing protein [Bacteroidales bacterium]